MKQAKKQPQKRTMISVDHVSVRFRMASDRVGTLKNL